MRGPRSHEHASRSRPLHGLLLLALVVKAAFVLALADVFFYGEELEKGTAAKAMLDGLGVPHHQLAYHYYEGGGFVASHLKALAFLAVGENLLAHKLVALLFVLLILWAGYAFTRDLFGGRAALWFGLLFVLGPASFQKLSLIQLGIHFEACLFVLLVLGQTARLVRAPRARPRDWLLLGLAAGFGTYFSYQVGVAAVFALAVLAARRPRRLIGAGAVWGLAGTLAGAAPLFVMFALVGRKIFDIHGASLVGGEGQGGARLAAFLRSVYLDGDLGGRFGPWLWTSAVGLAAILLLFDRAPVRKAQRRAAAYVVLYLACFLAVLASSGFAPGAVYHFFLVLRFAPAWILGLVLVAGALERLRADPDRRRRAAGAAAALGLLALGTWNAVAIVREGRPDVLARNWRILTRTKGYAYEPYFAKFVPHLSGDDSDRLRVLLRFREPDREWLASQAAASLFLAPGPDLGPTLERAEAVFREVDPSLVEAFRIGLGAAALRSAGWDLGTALRRAEALPPVLGERLLEGLGRQGSGRVPALAEIAREADLAGLLADPTPYLRGLGYRLSLNPYVVRDPDRAAAFLAEQPPERRAALRAGYERALAVERLP